MNLFLFHRDLRLIDNTSLIAQLKSFKSPVVPAFIFTPEQIDRKMNKYFSSNSVQFMIESLKDLNKQVQNSNGKMYYFYGDNLQVLNQIHSKVKINSVAYNLDYTPYAKKRDEEIEKWAIQRQIKVIAKQDYGLYNLMDIKFMGKNNTPPTFTPFKDYCYSNHKVRQPDVFKDFKFEKNQKLEQVGFSFDFKTRSDKLYDQNKDLAVHGGRQQALKIVNNFQKFTEYFKDRNFPALPATKLSAYLHFTNVSIRQVYHKVCQTLGKDNHLIFQLHCREFFTYITHKFPNVLQNEKYKGLKQEFNTFKWKKNQEGLKKWKQGKTGIPFIDAGMRQMNSTGYMHNRTRQNVACFLVKDLLIDWQEGEKYFAEKLVDYSPTQNSGNWQYVAGVGTDPRQVRIFNPWLQAKNYDPDCIYIKRWVPQLEQVPAKDILNWEQTCQFYLKKGVNYLKPMINHFEQTKKTKNIFNQVLDNGEYPKKNQPYEQKEKKYESTKQSEQKKKKIVYRQK